ncbi:MAG: hypothetical protein QM296_01580 [Bacillota bacterium]|nr:hypothetical protein [Bacillota bacterium]
MKVYEFGEDQDKTILIFQCTAEPWWVFEASARALARDFHVFLFISDGHDEQGTDFVSIEKNVEQAVAYLHGRGIHSLDMLYGISMGGSSVMYLLAWQLMPVKKAIVDAGITPSVWPKWLCRIIAMKDFIFVRIGFCSIRLMKAVMPPERWTPAGEDPEEHYMKLHDFGKRHYSSRTIYRVFWSANNYSMPQPVPATETEMEYWYGEEEKSARGNDILRARMAFPQIVLREFCGLAHAELVMMFPERFRQEVLRFWHG